MPEALYIGADKYDLIKSAIAPFDLFCSNAPDQEGDFLASCNPYLSIAPYCDGIKVLYSGDIVGKTLISKGQGWEKLMTVTPFIVGQTEQKNISPDSPHFYAELAD